MKKNSVLSVDFGNVLLGDLDDADDVGEHGLLLGLKHRQLMVHLA